MKNDVCLLVSPFFVPSYIPLAIPTLLTSLKNNGIKATSLDLNIEFWNKYVVKEDKINGINLMKEYLSKILLYKKRLKDLSNNSYIFDLKKLIINNDFSKVNKLVNFVLDDTYFSNLIYPFLNSQELDCDIIGISVSYEDQFIFSLIIAKILKSKGKKIIFGGSYISSIESTVLKDILDNMPICDCFIKYPGDNTLPAVCKKYLNEDYSFEYVPNIIWRNKNHSIINQENHKQYNLVNIIPDYSEINLDNYLSPFPFCSFLLTQGCYYRKCTFCTNYMSYGKCYNEKSVDTLLKELEMISNMGIKYVYFVDDAIKPNLLFELLSILKRYNFEWILETRLDKIFCSDEFCRRLYSAGCRLLSFGIESNSKTTLKKIHKGIDNSLLSIASKILNNNKIMVSSTFIVNFPWETEQDVKETLDFICEQENLNFFGLSNFALLRDSIIYKEIINNGDYHIKKKNVVSNVYSIEEFRENTESLKEFENINYISTHKKISSLIIHRMHFIMIDDIRILNMQNLKDD